MHTALNVLANAIRRMPKKRYLAYMRSPQWVRVRNEHLRRFPTCEVCRKCPAMQVHHFTYIRLGCELPQDLCAVCFQCHHVLHTSIMPEPANDNQAQLSLPLGQRTG